MKRYLRQGVMLLLCLCVLCLSGCSLLQLPVKIVDGTFGLLGDLVKLAGKMPLPPPWLF